LNQIAGGQVDSANPVVVDGYSQSSVISSLLMQQLASQGVPSDDVHFVLVGDESVPNGGLLERYDLPAGTQPTIPSLGLTFSGPEASDLYPADRFNQSEQLPVLIARLG
jgi:PE-PPE domain-containing protein